MAYLAAAGFDVFSMDMTGYGRSTRPNVMNDVCNLSAEQQTALGRTPCKRDARRSSSRRSRRTGTTSTPSSTTSARCATCAREPRRLVARRPACRRLRVAHADKVAKLVLLAPAYNRDVARQQPPQPSPAQGAAFNAQSHAEFTANWERQVGCQNQYEHAASDGRLARDARVRSRRRDRGGRACGARRTRPSWGFGKDAAKQIRAPTLMVAAHPRQASSARARARAISRISAPSRRCCSTSAARRITRCGSATISAVPRVARVADERYRARNEIGRREARLLNFRAARLIVDRRALPPGWLRSTSRRTIRCRRAQPRGGWPRARRAPAVARGANLGRKR